MCLSFHAHGLHSINNTNKGYDAGTSLMQRSFNFTQRKAISTLSQTPCFLFTYMEKNMLFMYVQLKPESKGPC